MTTKNLGLFPCAVASASLVTSTGADRQSDGETPRHDHERAGWGRRARALAASQRSQPAQETHRESDAAPRRPALHPRRPRKERMGLTPLLPDFPLLPNSPARPFARRGPLVLKTSAIHCRERDGALSNTARDDPNPSAR